jgi:glycosyltransferase involved in cell wall biosynthesis
MRAPRQQPAAALFSECYRPIVNGVVASIDALRAGLDDAGVGVTIVAPHFPPACDDDRAIVRLPSFPLPAPTAYRLCVPHLSRAARRRLRGASVVHAHSPFVTGWTGANFARRRGLPLVFTYHTRIDEYAHYAPLDANVARAALIALTRAFANRADVTIVPTRAMEARLREIGVRAPITVVPSAIDVERFANGRRTAAARALLGARDGERLVLTVSRIAREKNLELAIDALAACAPDVRLAIVGEGPVRAALEARAVERGVAGRVVFTGALDPSALPDLYASSDAFAFPSTTETQGLVLAEAMAAGLPVVAADVPVNREMMAGFGRLEPPDAARFAAALAAALAGPRCLAGAAAVRERFGRARHAAAVLDVYRFAAECRTFGTPVGDDAFR